MNKKEQTEEKIHIREEVRSLINRGRPKQEILEELSQKYKNKISIVKQLEFTPSVAMKNKYMILNNVFILLLLAAFVLDIITLFQLGWIAPESSLSMGKPQNYFPLINALSILNVGLDAILLAGVVLYRIGIYSWIAARALVSMLQIIITHAYYQQPIDILTWIVLVLIVTSFFIGLFLGVKLCPPRVPKTIEIDIDGVEKINKTIYVFPD